MPTSPAVTRPGGGGGAKGGGSKQQQRGSGAGGLTSGSKPPVSPARSKGAVAPVASGISPVAKSKGKGRDREKHAFGGGHGSAGSSMSSSLGGVVPAPIHPGGSSKKSAGGLATPKRATGSVTGSYVSGEATADGGFHGRQQDSSDPRKSCPSAPSVRGWQDDGGVSGDGNAGAGRRRSSSVGEHGTVDEEGGRGRRRKIAKSFGDAFEEVRVCLLVRVSWLQLVLG